MFSDRTIAGPGGKLKDVTAIAVGPDGSLFVGEQDRRDRVDAERRAAAVGRQPASRARCSWTPAAALVALQKAVLQQEGNAGTRPVLVTLTVPRDGGPAKVLEDISAVGGALDRRAPRRGPRQRARCSGSMPRGKYVGRSRRSAPTAWRVGPGDQVALLDRDNKSVAVFDRTGKAWSSIAPGAATGYELTKPTDVAFDVLGHLYVLDRRAVSVFAPDGRLVTSFAIADKTAGAFRDASGARARPGAAGSTSTTSTDERVQVYQ